MKKLILPLLLLLSSTGLAQSLGRYNNWCEEGGQIVVLQGLNSVTNVQQSAPMCTVEVFLSGTNTHASLFADNSGSPTPLSNPFTASTTGQFGFYATPGVFYDVVTSNGIPTLPSTVTYPYVIVSTPGTGTGTVTGFSSGNLSPLFTTSVATASSTPALTFTLTNANAHKWFGNNTGSTAAPGYETIGTSDLPFTYSGNTTELMTVGTVSGTGSTLCTDASGNATTVGCSGGGGGLSGSGTANSLAMWTGTTTLGNAPETYDPTSLLFTLQTGNPVGTGAGGSIFIVTGTGTGVAASGGISIETANSSNGAGAGSMLFSAGSATGTTRGGNGGGVVINAGQGDNASGSVSGGSLRLNGGTGAGVGGLVQLFAGSGIGGNGGDITIEAGQGSGAGNHSGSINLVLQAPISGASAGSVNFGNSITQTGIGLSGGNGNFVTLLGSATTTNWNLTFPVNAGTNTYLLGTNGSGVTSWNPPDPITTANCAASGTGANPSVVACGAAKAGAVYCDVAASAGTCQINTSAVTANSEVFVIPNTTEGSRLGKTCNAAPSAPPAILLVSKSAGNNFIINMSTVTTNGECYDYLIVN